MASAQTSKMAREMLAAGGSTDGLLSALERLFFTCLNQITGYLTPCSARAHFISLFRGRHLGSLLASAEAAEPADTKLTGTQ